MPHRLPHPCPVTGCPALVASGQRFCPAHADRERGEHRAYAERRTDDAEQDFYRSAQWKRLRAWQLRREPLCEECAKQGQVVPATVVDHRTPIKQGGARLDPDNLQSICIPHHNQKTANEKAGAGRR